MLPHKSTTAWLGAACIAFGLAACGCRDETVELSSLASTSQSDQRSGSDNSRLESPRVIEHDFGILKPRSVAKHQFTIRNDSSQRWTLRLIENSCSCTASSASAKFVDPGSAITVDVSYRAPPETAEDRRTVSIWFEEPDVPHWTLAVRASVRERITVSQAALVFRGVPVGGVARSKLQVYSFDDRDWTNLSVRSDAKWLHFGSPTRLPGAAFERARQRWEFVIDVSAAGLAPGRYSGELVVSSVGSTPGDKRVPVELSVSSPVEAMPGRLFFGEVKLGESSERKITLRFADNPQEAPQYDAVVLSESLQGLVNVSYRRATARFGELAVTLTPREAGLLRGLVTLKFDRAKLPSLDIPVHALVR